MELELLGSIFSRLGEASGRGGEQLFRDYLTLNTSLIEKQLMKYFAEASGRGGEKLFTAYLILNTSLMLLYCFFTAPFTLF